jgi:2-methylcitrate dehydratase PrpD
MTRLAAAGFRGPEHVLEAPRGLFAGHDIPLEEPVLVDGFADMSAVLYVTPKHFACSHSVAPYLDAIAAWESAHGEIDAAAIESAVVQIDADEKRIRQLPDLSQPLTLIAAQLNPIMPVAIYLVKGDLFVEQWEEGAQWDPEVLSLAGRFTAVTSRDSSTRVVFHMRGGSVVEVPVELRYGDPFPPDREDVYRSKFRRLTRRTLDDRQAGEVIDRVLALDREPDVADFLARLRELVAAGRSPGRSAVGADG